MKKAIADKSEDLLLIKSLLIVTVVVAAGLVLLRHASPVEKEKKFFGGGVSLLLAHNETDAREFRRWAELNNPANVFGYNSAGIFTRAVPRKVALELPKVRSANAHVPESELYRQKELETPEFTMEKSILPETRVELSNLQKKTPFSFKNIPVFDEKGNVAAYLETLPETNMMNTLLIRCVKGSLGSEFRVMESSGDVAFDRTVIRELEKFAAQGKVFSGILAVWPESKGGSR